jgi:hypothetical protein
MSWLRNHCICHLSISLAQCALQTWVLKIVDCWLCTADTAVVEFSLYFPLVRDPVCSYSWGQTAGKYQADKVSQCRYWVQRILRSSFFNFVSSAIIALWSSRVIMPYRYLGFVGEFWNVSLFHTMTQHHFGFKHCLIIVITQRDA